MTIESTVSTPVGHLKRMTEHGQLTTSVTSPNSDLNDPETYPDHEGLKPERAALGAIIGARAYQRARRTFLNEETKLSQPPTTRDTELRVLRYKKGLISSAFIESFVDGLQKDEKDLKTREKEHPAVQAYDRLEDILHPLQYIFPNNPDMQIITDRSFMIVEEPSMTFRYVYGGVDALPQNLDSLFLNTIELYEDKFGKKPDAKTLIRYMKNSYDSFIKPIASMHKGDSLDLIRKGINNRQETGKSGLFELQEDRLGFTAEIVAEIDRKRKAKADLRSKTVRCPFLMPTKKTEQFLDQPAEFEVPLKDAFDLHMRMLAA